MSPNCCRVCWPWNTNNCGNGLFFTVTPVLSAISGLDTSSVWQNTWKACLHTTQGSTGSWPQLAYSCHLAPFLVQYFMRSIPKRTWQPVTWPAVYHIATRWHQGWSHNCSYSLWNVYLMVFSWLLIVTIKWGSCGCQLPVWAYGVWGCLRCCLNSSLWCVKMMRCCMVKTFY